MITKNQAKFIRGLKLKKNRQQSGCFVVEGEKIVEDLLNRDWEILDIYALPDWLQHFAGSLQRLPGRVHEVDAETLKKISSMKAPNRVLALVRMPGTAPLPPIRRSELILAMDGIQDPGNMGTILRTASWFGVGHIFNAKTCVDVFNPKVIQASMSAIFDVQVHTVDLEEMLKTATGMGIPVFGTFPEGKNVYQMDLPDGGMVLLGNESRGLSGPLVPYIDYRISIPASPGLGRRSVESLNVAAAAAIICSEFRRRKT